MGFWANLFKDDISKLSEYDCYMKAQTEYWDFQTGTHSNPSKALQYLDQAIKLNPKKAEAYWARGIAYQKLENFNNAIDNFNRAIELEPSSKNYQSRGLCYQQFKNSNNALEDLAFAIKLDHDDIANYFIRAGIYASLGQFKLSILDYNIIIERQPYSFEAYFSRGYQYHELFEYEKAIEDYDHAIKLQPDVAIIHQYRDLAQQELNKN